MLMEAALKRPLSPSAEDGGGPPTPTDGPEQRAQLNVMATAYFHACVRSAMSNGAEPYPDDIRAVLTHEEA